MTVLLLFMYGFFFCFAGSITPSMLNMTALKISLEKGENEAKKYALGISLLVFPQTIIAIFLTRYISENPNILETLEKLGIVIFLLLSFYFYKESKKSKKNIETGSSKQKSSFMVGIAMSILNMFAIPFLSGVILFLEEINQFTRDPVSLLYFVLGCVLGTYFILVFYAKFAKKMQQKTGKLTKNINLILAFLTGFVAVFTFIRVFI